MPSSGGAATELKPEGAHTAFESFDGQLLYFTRAGRPGLWRMRPGGGPETAVPVELAANCGDDWRVTSRGMYFRVDRGDADPEVRFLPAGGTTATTVATLGAQAWEGFTVSPDDSMIVYGRADRRDCDIRMVENAF